MQAPTMAYHDQAVVGDGSGRVFGVGFDPEDMDGVLAPLLTRGKGGDPPAPPCPMRAAPRAWRRRVVRS